MNKQNKISLKHGYTLKIDENDMVSLSIEAEDGVLEFDGIKGNLMDASDFETHYTDEDIEYTTSEYRSASLSFLTDWGVDREAAEAIIEELTPWFERYAIEKPQPDAWLKVLEDRVEELRKETEAHEDHVNKKIARLRKKISTASDFDIYYGAEEWGKEITKARETYKAVWTKYKEAEAELFRYKDTMHIR